MFGDLLPVETHSAEETVALGRQLGASLGAGDVVALYGELGAGKTHLVKGICAALDISQHAVASPTYTIVHEYKGRTPVYHLDAYRITEPRELYELGYEDYFYSDGICLVEWPERIASLLPEGTLRLVLRHLGDHRRYIGGARDTS